MGEQKKVLVTGAGGFIGGHLTTYLKAKGYWVRGVDIKLPEFRATTADEFELLDLRRSENCLKATEGVDHVYALAADMGGMGFISIIMRRYFTTIRSSVCTLSRPPAKTTSADISSRARPVSIPNISRKT